MSEQTTKPDGSEELENKNITEDIELTGLKAFEALVEDNESFNEEFKTKASTIFESAMNSAKKKLKEEAEKEKEDKLKAEEEEKEKEKEELQESINKYITYAAEEWIKSNQVAIDSSLRLSITEDFMSGLKNLFEEHYIDVPESKVDLLEQTSARADELETKFEEAQKELNKQKMIVEDFQRKEIIAESTKNLTDSQREKFEELVESVDFESSEKFTKKVTVLLESFNSHKPEKQIEKKLDEHGQTIVEDTSEGDEIQEEIDPDVAAVIKAISSNKR
jgi:F0F1-type ATP synthase membrane subunit b/b'